MKTHSLNRYLENFSFGCDSDNQWLDKPITDIPFVLFDLESTGGNPSHSGITEICAFIVKNGEVQGRFYSLVNPQRRIPKIVRKITGITDVMVKDAPFIADVMPDFLDFVKDYPVVSHNCQGDLKFLRYFAREVAGKDFKNFFACTHLLGCKYFPDSPHKTLGGLAEYTGASVDTAHRAEADALLTKGLFDKILLKIAETKIRTFRELISDQCDIESLVRMGSKVSIADPKPATFGYIMLFDRHRQRIACLYSMQFKKEVNRLTNLKYVQKQQLKYLCVADSLVIKTFLNEFDFILQLQKLENVPLVSIFPQSKFNLLTTRSNKNGIEFTKNRHIKFKNPGVLCPKSNLDALLSALPEIKNDRMKRFAWLFSFLYESPTALDRMRLFIWSRVPAFELELTKAMSALRWTLPMPLNGHLFFRSKKRLRIFRIDAGVIVELSSDIIDIQNNDLAKTQKSISAFVHKLKPKQPVTPSNKNQESFKALIHFLFLPRIRKMSEFLPDSYLNNKAFLSNFLKNLIDQIK